MTLLWFPTIVVLLSIQTLFLEKCSASADLGDDDDHGRHHGMLRFRHEESATNRNRRSAQSPVELDASYDPELPPSKIDGKYGVPVKFRVTIFSVREINEILQELSIEMRLQIWWLDTRLNNWMKKLAPGQEYISLPRNISNNVWHPDIFIDFVKKIEQPQLLGASALSLRYYDNGFLRTSARVTIKMACTMNFHYYPVDRQHCNVDMKSYAYNNRTLFLQWDSEPNNKPLSLTKRMTLPNFALGIDNPANISLTTNSGNVYTSIRFIVLLQRKLSYHMIQTYIPSGLFVAISWLSFLVPPESVPGRMAICMTTLLTQTTMFSAIRQNIPKVSYPKAIDIWMVACIFFVFLALVEYALILKLRFLIPKEEARLHVIQQSNILANDEAMRKRKTSDKSSDGFEPAPPYNKFKDNVKFLEKYTWMTLIFLFGVFNLVYWPWLLSSAGYYDKLGENLLYSEAE